MTPISPENLTAVASTALFGFRGNGTTNTQNMEVQILVTVQISFDDDTPDFEPGDPGEERMRESAKAAVENALELVEGAGFSHDMACIASVGVVACEVFTPNTKPMEG